MRGAATGAANFRSIHGACVTQLGVVWTDPVTRGPIMSVYIVVSGPDADKRIARHVTFCSSVKGRTSLSCSGMAPSYTTYIRANSHVGSRQPAHHTHNTCPTPRPSSAASAIANGRAKGGLLFAGVVWGSFEGRLRILTAAAALQPFLEPRSGRLLEDVRCACHGTQQPVW